MSETNLYAFDADSFEVAFNARPNAENPAVVYHRLRKPTLAELIEREGQIKYELVEVNQREEEIRTDDETATARLWDKLILAVKAYRDAPGCRELSPEEQTAFRHVLTMIAVHALSASSPASRFH